MPDPGVTDTLTVPSADLSIVPGTGEYYGGDDDDVTTRPNPEFGNTYTLTEL